MNSSKIKTIIEKCLNENPCEIDIRYDEPMREHTTFKIGGPADCWVRPAGFNFTSFCISLLNRANEEKIPVFILGGGANVVVSDKGIRGIVLDMTNWKGLSDISLSNEKFVFNSGTSINEAADITAAAGFSGFEFLAGMPGTIGGAVWMNARCYGKEMSDVLEWVEIIKREKRKEKRVVKPSVWSREYGITRINIGQEKILERFSYKKSPFQEMDCLILRAAFKLTRGDKGKIISEMEKNRQDRQNKGHYLYPSAGSAFKNNTDFGKPTGQIIDELGLKGLQIGGAQIAPFHANITINTGNAAAADIHALIDEVKNKVKIATGFELEPEILFVGEW
jgi:UDP-N-acetylmuramate dehydrogenase